MVSYQKIWKVMFYCHKFKKNKVLKCEKDQKKKKKKKDKKFEKDPKKKKKKTLANRVIIHK